MKSAQFSSWAVGRLTSVWVTYVGNFHSQRDRHGLQPLHNFWGESVLRWLLGQTLQLTNRKVDRSTCEKSNLKWLACCLYTVLGDSQSSRWWEEGPVVKGWYGRQNLSKTIFWRCIHELANTHLHDLMTRWLKPSRHTCSIWPTDDASQQVRCLWLFVGQLQQILLDSVYEFVCEHDRCLHSEHNMYTQSGDLVNDQNMVASMTLLPTCKSCMLKNQARCTLRLTWAHRVNPSVWKNQVKLSKEALKLDVGQNFGGWCSRYDTWQQTGRTPASLFWFIDNTGAWSFREYSIIVRVTSASPFTPWIDMAHLFPYQSNTTKFQLGHNFSKSWSVV